MAYPVQPVEWLDTGNALRTGLDAAAQLQKTQLLREENEQRLAAQQYIDPALKGDVGAMGRLISGDPRAAQIVGNTTQQMAVRQKELRQLQLQFADDTIAMLEGAPEADRARVFAERRAQAEANGWPVTMWPQEYSQPWHAMEKSRVVGIKQQEEERNRNQRALIAGPYAHQPYYSGGNPPTTPPATPPPTPPATAPAAPGSPGPVAAPPPAPSPPPAQPPMRITPQRPNQRTSMVPMGTPNVMQASYSPAGQSGPATWGPAIRNIESGSRDGNYQAVGPVTMVNGRPARPYGAYQVMDFNVGPWTREVLGVEMTPQQFLASKPAQDLVFNAKFGQFVAQTGNPQDAASIWFTGQPRSQAGGARDVLGTSNDVYQARFNAGMGGSGGGFSGGPGQMPVYGQDASGGAGNGPGVAPAVYALPATYRSAALDPGRVYNDGSGRAEPGGPVLGPASGGGDTDGGFIRAQQTVPLPQYMPPLPAPVPAPAPPPIPAPAPAPGQNRPRGREITPEALEAEGGMVLRDPKNGQPIIGPDGGYTGKPARNAPDQRYYLPKNTQRQPSPHYMWIDPNNPEAGERFIPQGPADPATITREAEARKAATGPNPLPAKIVEGLAESLGTLRKVDDALKELDKNPNSIGGWGPTGASVVPGGAFLLDKADPQGAPLRSIIANIASLKIHSVSGATVTAGEEPRLLQYIPKISDDPAIARGKLNNFAKELMHMMRDTTVQYESSGFSPYVPGEKYFKEREQKTQAPKLSPVEIDASLFNARKAIREGRDRGAVEQKLRDNGIDPALLEQRK